MGPNPTCYLRKLAAALHMVTSHYWTRRVRMLHHYTTLVRPACAAVRASVLAWSHAFPFRFTCTMQHTTPRHATPRHGTARFPSFNAPHHTRAHAAAMAVDHAASLPAHTA